MSAPPEMPPLPEPLLHDSLWPKTQDKRDELAESVRWYAKNHAKRCVEAATAGLVKTNNHLMRANVRAAARIAELEQINSGLVKDFNGMLQENARLNGQYTETCETMGDRIAELERAPGPGCVAHKTVRPELACPYCEIERLRAGAAANRRAFNEAQARAEQAEAELAEARRGIERITSEREFAMDSVDDLAAEALAQCKDIHEDYDEEEIKSAPRSIQDAWAIGRKVNDGLE